MKLHTALELEVSGEENIEDEEVQKDFVEEVKCPLCKAVAYKFNFFEKGELVYSSPRRWGFGGMSDYAIARYRAEHPVTYRDAKRYWFIACPLELVPEHISLEAQFEKVWVSPDNIVLSFRFRNTREYLAELQKKEEEGFGFEKAVMIVLKESDEDFSRRKIHIFISAERIKDKLERLLKKLKE